MRISDWSSDVCSSDLRQCRSWAITAKTCTGDGLLMGQEVGADIAGHNRGLLLTTPGFYRDLEVFVPGWLVYVNREGRRFINETTEYAVMAGEIGRAHV